MTYDTISTKIILFREWRLNREFAELYEEMTGGDGKL